MKLKIDVTQDHIDNGKKGDCFFCPIALAFIDAGFNAVRVHYYSAYIYGQNADFWVRLPAIATDFIRNFDTLKSAKPFSFEVEINET